MVRITITLVCAMLAACGRVTVGEFNLEGRPCDAQGACANGFVCDQSTLTCMPPLSGGDASPGDAGLGDPAMGDPGLGDPNPGDPGLGDPGVGDPGLGDPGVGDPGLGDPGIACQMILVDSYSNGAANISIETPGCAVGDPSEITCVVPTPVTIADVDFDQNLGGWNGNDVERHQWMLPNHSVPQCSSSGAFAWFRANRPGGLIGHYLTGNAYKDFIITGQLAYGSVSDMNDTISLSVCIDGGGCDPTKNNGTQATFEFPNGLSAGGSNACHGIEAQVPSIALGTLRLAFNWGETDTTEAGLDNVMIQATPIVEEVQATSTGYRTSVRSPLARQFAVECTWDNNLQAAVTESISLIFPSPN